MHCGEDGLNGKNIVSLFAYRNQETVPTHSNIDASKRLEEIKVTLPFDSLATARTK